MSIQPIFRTVDALKAQLTNLSIDALKREIATRPDLLLVDIREIQETVDLGTIPGAVHVPRGMLEFWADPASPYFRDYFDEAKRIVVFCAGGGRSAFAAKALLDMGYRDVAHLEAGFNGWKKAGEPIEDVAGTSRWMRKPDANAEADPRPPVWIGHVALFVPDIGSTKAFFEKLGVRLIGAFDGVVVMELRGGTHLIVLPANEPVEARARAPFDLMVDDLDAAHAAWSAAGLAPSPIERGDVHRSFTVVEPGGHAITVNDTHVSDLPV